MTAMRSSMARGVGRKRRFMLQNHQVVAVDNLGARQFAGPQLFRAEPRDAARELSAVQIAHAHDVAGHERPFTTAEARRKQALAFFTQRRARPVVDEERALGMMKEGDPTFVAFQTAGAWNEEGSHLLPCQNLLQHGRLAARRDEEWDAA